MKSGKTPFALAGAFVMTFVVAVWALPVSSAAAPTARLEAGEKQISEGEAARFKVDAPAGQTSEFHGFCTLTAEGGSVNVAVDGIHYVPLSPPAVGDVLTLQPGEVRSYEMTGTFEPNATGQAEIGFIFSGSPKGFCFPGQQCSQAAEAAAALKVECGNR